MDNIKISVDVNVHLSEKTENFISSLVSKLISAPAAPTSSPAAPAVPAAPKTEKPATVPAAPKTEKPATVAAPAVQAPAVQAPAVQAPAVQAPAVQAPAVQAPAAKTELTINDVRSVVASKAATHRNEIKSKLAELGAQNVTTLDPSNYQAFVDYLNSLN